MLLPGDLASPVDGSAQTGNPVRTCVGCRARCAPEELLRVVLAEGSLVPDPHRRMPGRGAWIHPSSDCLAAAGRRRAWTRALRAGGPVDVTGLDQYLEGLPGSLPEPSRPGQQV